VAKVFCGIESTDVIETAPGHLPGLIYSDGEGRIYSKLAVALTTSNVA
jgi:hypothetical protein